MTATPTKPKDIIEELRSKIIKTLRGIISASGGTLSLSGRPVRISMYDKHIDERHDALVTAGSLVNEADGSITFCYSLDGKQYDENMNTLSSDEIQRITDLVI